MPPPPVVAGAGAGAGRTAVRGTLRTGVSSARGGWARGLSAARGFDFAFGLGSSAGAGVTFTGGSSWILPFGASGAACGWPCAGAGCVPCAGAGCALCAGAGCAYLEVWHNDIVDFLELRRNTGDERRRTHDMNTACWIPDLFMKRVEAREPWTLFRSSDVADLHETFGERFERRYVEHEELAPTWHLGTCHRRRSAQPATWATRHAPPSG